MTPCDLWQCLRGRTTWIIGDSISKDLMKALKCFMLEFWDLQQYATTNNKTALQQLKMLPGKEDPLCIHMPHQSRICQVRVGRSIAYCTNH
eukprot:jgi/Chrzof1/5496/Cz16g05130.t1